MKVTKNNYREYYKKYFGIDFGNEFEIHHIDGNRDNNNIDNLILIPDKTHSDFHQTSRFFSEFTKISPDLAGINQINVYCADELERYVCSVSEIKRYFEFKKSNYEVRPKGILKIY
nr:MAG TPA: HNH endonuclease [Caudoviricetes sp.]